MRRLVSDCNFLNNVVFSFTNSPLEIGPLRLATSKLSMLPENSFRIDSSIGWLINVVSYSMVNFNAVVKVKNLLTIKYNDPVTTDDTSRV